jgi:hypothetical protein
MMYTIYNDIIFIGILAEVLYIHYKMYIESGRFKKIS